MGLGVQQPASTTARPGAEAAGPEQHVTSAVAEPGHHGLGEQHADSATGRPERGVDGEQHADPANSTDGRIGRATGGEQQPAWFSTLA